jgi:hypothetical protein
MVMSGYCHFLVFGSLMNGRPARVRLVAFSTKVRVVLVA